ncbi:MAG: hypothetical protein ACOYXC_14800 [Candidatus Rifleibacteriota bacterium]
MAIAMLLGLKSAALTQTLPQPTPSLNLRPMFSDIEKTDNEYQVDQESILFSKALPGISFVIQL